MKSIFEQGFFQDYAQSSLNESRAAIIECSQAGVKRTTVFISHKHDDLDDLKGLLGFLEKTYDVKVYIDSRDTTIPQITSSETAVVAALSA